MKNMTVSTFNYISLIFSLFLGLNISYKGNEMKFTVYMYEF